MNSVDFFVFFLCQPKIKITGPCLRGCINVNVAFDLL